LARMRGPSVPSSMPNFTPYRCNVSPLRGEKPQNWPLSKLNTGRLALRGMLPVIMIIIIIIIIITHIRIPEIYAYCHSAYSQSSILFHGPYTVSSQDRPQQGDPVGPLLFCNTIQPMLSSLESELNLGYPDDVSLGGPVGTVAADIARIAKEGAEMGQHLNASKCASGVRCD